MWGQWCREGRGIPGGHRRTVREAGSVLRFPTRGAPAKPLAMQGNSVLDYGELTGLAAALALGLLVGIQRGWVQRREPAGHRFAGIRTYGLLGFAGGIAGA